MDVGFIGLGIMGEPMALNLVRAGTPLIAWNRSASKGEALRAAGAKWAATSEDVFRHARIVILMLADGAAMDAVLERGERAFIDNVADHTIVHMGTTSPEYSRALGAAICGAGGRYVEAPVSGSRKPAENGQLVAMLAGQAADVDEIRNLLRPICHQAILCGAVPNALLMKLAVNLFLITMVTGLVEATHFADKHGLNVQRFLEVLEAGPMSSSVSRQKMSKLVASDFSAQAAVSDVLKNNRLIAEAARRANLASPLLDACYALFGEADTLGNGASDMVAVIRAIEARSERLARTC